MLLRYSIISSLLLSFHCILLAQNNTQPQPITFKKLNNALEYAFIVDKPTKQKPQDGDAIKLHMASAASGRYIYNSWLQNNGKPAEFGVQKALFTGDIIDAIKLMTVGDSIVCQVNADIVYKNTKQKKPDFVKPGDKIVYMIRLISIKTKDQLAKEQQEQINKQLQEQLEKQKKEEAEQIKKDEKLLSDYFTKNNLMPQKTLNGLYYIITETTNGNMPKKDDTVSLNYTGKLIDGTVFDSNIDSIFGHVTPFNFALGNNAVIRGWDDGVALLPLGSKATFYIPSRLGYGSSTIPGNPNNPKGIPANSILIFDVELINIKPLKQNNGQ